MKKQQTRHLNEISSFLVRHRIWTFKPLRGDWRGQLAQLQTAEWYPLPPGIEAKITRECDRLHHLRAPIGDIRMSGSVPVNRLDELLPGTWTATGMAQAASGKTTAWRTPRASRTSPPTWPTPR